MIEPSLTLTKTASADVVRASDEVTYTFAVTNTGDVGLVVVGPVDDKCADLTFTGGDTNGNELLDGANSAAPETWTYTCARSRPPARRPVAAGPAHEASSCQARAGPSFPARPG